MTIKRHPSNAILSSAVEHAGLVYLAGQVADDLSQDVKGQTRQILATIDRLLAAAGSGKSGILSVNIWLADIRTRDEMNEAWLAWADPANLPARATVEAKLANPRMLVEIMLVAAKQ
ncbi:RidA family protein [Roseateles toxinivorans]|uniref:Enamine deaminase RidA (YjgF/YER057c/UK114 family) n=1 Tax=Roseateles toxinivorans TaxID=270368 RepID=A0A4R6QH85_9BURK|nr:RidA family protein [Roseateles toxinivorans]TDP62063.1 enamine deaminase RidA (YjgF/YER057c/UK114 family) [Roseateles toxinivorans]